VVRSMYEHGKLSRTEKDNVELGMTWRSKSRFIAPDDDCVAKGTKLLSEIYRGGSRDGEMRDEADVIRWQYGRNKAALRWRLRHPLSRPDFFVTELGTKSKLMIRRASRIPSVFEIIEDGKAVGRIKTLSILRNKYSITIDDVRAWTFRMPLFTVFFFGESRDGAEIWVRVGPSERQWSILIKHGVVQRPLAAALAFIHNERYFRG
jgi:hypothetical protein